MAVAVAVAVSVLVVVVVTVVVVVVVVVGFGVVFLSLFSPGPPKLHIKPIPQNKCWL